LQLDNAARTDDSKRTDRGIDLTIDIDATLEEVWRP